METTNKSIGNFNELVFENRHKAYGAYALRKSYHDHVTVALFFTSLFFGLLAITASSLNKGKESMSKNSGNIINDSVQIYTYDFPKPPEPKVDNPEKPVEEVKPKTDILDYKVEDKIIQDALPTNDKAMIIPNGDIKGADSSDSVKPFGVFIVDKPEEIEKGPYYSADEPPEFSGNINQFFNDHIHYPQIAKENGTHGTVGLSFVIEKDGSLGNIKILHEVGDGCTEEAIRVLKMMPKWKPGKVKGEPVRVFFNLPVKFNLK